MFVYTVRYTVSSIVLLPELTCVLHIQTFQTDRADKVIRVDQYLGVIKTIKIIRLPHFFVLSCHMPSRASARDKVMIIPPICLMTGKRRMTEHIFELQSAKKDTTKY